MTAFLALLRRDLLVASRNAPMLLMATLTQPILVVLVFGNILPRLGLVADEFRTVREAGGDLRHVSLNAPSLEDVYIHLTGRELRE